MSLADELERDNARIRGQLIAAPKAGADASTQGTVYRIATSDGVVVELDLSDFIGRWMTIRAETEDVGWFLRPADSTVDPSLTATTASNPGRQCARQVAEDPARPFVVENEVPEFAAVGTGAGFVVIEVADF